MWDSEPLTDQLLEDFFRSLPGLAEVFGMFEQQRPLSIIGL